MSESKVAVAKKNNCWDKIFFAFILAFCLLEGAMTFYINSQYFDYMQDNNEFRL